MLDGDLVIIYERHDSLDYMYLEAGKMLNCKHVRIFNVRMVLLHNPLMHCLASRSRAHSIMMTSSTNNSAVKYIPASHVDGYMP